MTQTKNAQGPQGSQGNYYGKLRRFFLVNSLLVPLAPMLIVGICIFLIYDFNYSSLAHHPSVANNSDALAFGLFWSRTASVSVLVLAIAFMAYKARGLSRRMSARVAKADAEKQRLNEQMFQTAKLASIGELAAGVAHEINNPIAVMIEEAGWMQDLLTEEDLKDLENHKEFQRSLEQIRVQGQRCKEITSNLLSFARREDADTAEARIGDLLGDLLSVIERRARKRGVSVSLHIEDGLPPVKISYSELQQIVFNLINNALDAMEDQGGGKLDVFVGREHDAIRVDVEDTGTGVSEEHMSRLFDPFYTTKPVGRGTGLGLSICYGLVRKWGGRIKLENTGNGARVWFTIPLKQPNTTTGRGTETTNGAEACVCPKDGQPDDAETARLDQSAGPSSA